MSKLIKIDDLLIPDHYYLDDTDDCYYFHNYTARAGYSASVGNGLIDNFKKDLEKYGHRSEVMHYKNRAIRTVADLLASEVPTLVDISEATLVPIPPSKTKAHPFHDNRMSQALKIASANLRGDVDIRDLIVLNEDMEAVHKAEHRPKPHELLANMHLHRGLKGDFRDTVVLFDDVVTTGAHFVACRDLIWQEFPDTTVIGVFVARRVLERPDLLADLSDPT